MFELQESWSKVDHAGGELAKVFSRAFVYWFSNSSWSTGQNAPPQWNMSWHIPGNRKSSKIGGELMHLRVPSQSKHCHSVSYKAALYKIHAKSIACPVPTIPMCVYLWP